jgi:hypothetical protein
MLLNGKRLYIIAANSYNFIQMVKTQIFEKAVEGLLWGFSNG